jgi:hypothetical protein
VASAITKEMQIDEVTWMFMTLGNKRGRERRERERKRERALVKSMYQACSCASAVRCGGVQCSAVQCRKCVCLVLCRACEYGRQHFGWQLNLTFQSRVVWWLSLQGPSQFHFGLYVASQRQGKPRPSQRRLRCAALSSVPPYGVLSTVLLHE